MIDARGAATSEPAAAAILVRLRARIAGLLAKLETYQPAAS